MSTSKQDKAFEEIMISHIEPKIGNAALDEAIDFICNEFSPDEVFPEDQLSAWAEKNGYTKE